MIKISWGGDQNQAFLCDFCCCFVVAAAVLVLLLLLLLLLLLFLLLFFVDVVVDMWCSSSCCCKFPALVAWLVERLLHKKCHLSIYKSHSGHMFLWYPVYLFDTFLWCYLSSFQRCPYKMGQIKWSTPTTRRDTVQTRQLQDWMMERKSLQGQKHQKTNIIYEM